MMCLCSCSVGFVDGTVVEYDNADKYTAGDREITDRIDSLDIDWVSGSVNVNASATSKVELSKNENVQNAAQQAAHQAMNNAVLQAQTTVSQTVNNTENSTNVSNVTNTSGGVNNQTSVTNVNSGTAIPPAVHATNVPIIIQGADGKDGRDGREGQRGKDGRNGQDGKDGKDGLDSTNIALPPDNNDNQ